MYTHAPREYGGDPQSPADIARELPYDAVAAPWALEGLDLLTDAPEIEPSLRLWAFLLRRGLRLPALGFSDDCYDRKGEAPGGTRTFVRIDGGERTFPAIAAAIRAGRTFATTGPLVLFTVDGSPPGTVFPAGATAREVRIRAWNAADHLDPRRPALLTRAVVLRDGEPWKELPAPPGAHAAEWELEIVEPSAACYAVRIDGSSREQVAVTGPVYFDGPGRPLPSPKVARVHGRVTGPAGEPLDGRAEAVEWGKGFLRKVAEAEVRGGEYRIDCPADCRIRITSPGHGEALKSIFLDADPSTGVSSGLSGGEATDPEFYREIERRLDDVTLDFRLEPQ